MSQNFRLFHISNLSVRNFLFFLFMYTGSVTAISAAIGDEIVAIDHGDSAAAAAGNRIGSHDKLPMVLENKTDSLRGKN